MERISPEKNRQSVRRLLALGCLILSGTAQAQLKAGLDTAECIYALRLGAEQLKKVDSVSLSGPEWTLVHRSAEVGLYNRLDIWKQGNGTIWVNLRGTTAQSLSWIENFYSVMVPAQGRMVLTDGHSVEYDFSDHPRASVHAGWTLGTLSLAQILLPKLDSLYEAGHRDWVITGHSQGGALTYLTTALLRRKQTRGAWTGTRIKSYATAAPKPGNLYFAYSYEHLCGFGWHYTLVNAADWVPETPFSIQTLGDFNPTNPFKGAREQLKAQPWPKDWVLLSMYGKLEDRLEDANETFEEYLGEKLFDLALEPAYPLLQYPETADNMNYARCGTAVILYPDAAYFQRFPIEQSNVFGHHMFDAYGWFFGVDL